jgi:lipid-binding SYLF domain-containing protein
MVPLRYLAPAVVFFVQTLPASHCQAQVREDAIVRDSAAVLNEIMAIELSGIPMSMLAEAHGVAIIPNVIKGSFVIGARHGKGVLLVRADDGNWHAPSFVSLTGGNVGWQIGVQATDVILVFKTRKSIDGILSGKLTIGADAAAAAGPVGRKAAAATDGRLRAEIYSYSRSRGLFAGVSIDGSVLQVDHFANAAYYRRPGPGQPVVVPPAAIGLTQQVAAYATTSETTAIPKQPRSGVASTPSAVLNRYANLDDAAIVRNELAKIAPELFERLDDQWKAYLGLPAEVFSGAGHPSVESLHDSLERFEAVRADTQYSSLTKLPEFQSTYGILRHYVSTLTQHSEPLNLPPPPSN